ncbi:MAG: hypothetical protein AB8B61_03160 [Cyclobacteriaceae bacterium]
MNNSFNNSVWNQYYQKLTTWYYAVLCIPLFIFGLKYMSTYSNDPISKDQFKSYFLEPLPIAIMVLGLVITLFLKRDYRKKANRISVDKTLEEKLSFFKQTVLNYLFLSQGIALLVVGIYYFTNFLSLAVVYGIILVVTMLERPSVYKIFRLMKFTREQRKVFLGREEGKLLGEE